MLEAGKSVVTVARWLGHSSPAITPGHCAHFMPEAGSEGRTVMAGLLGRQGDLRVGRNSPESPQSLPRADHGKISLFGTSGADRGLQG